MKRTRYGLAGIGSPLAITTASTNPAVVVEYIRNRICGGFDATLYINPHGRSWGWRRATMQECRELHAAAAAAKSK
jgi:creatinine amidohydrolase/Fe(II)-dependent formamide hydrolase-like protein